MLISQNFTNQQKLYCIAYTYIYIYALSFLVFNLYIYTVWAFFSRGPLSRCKLIPHHGAPMKMFIWKWWQGLENVVRMFTMLKGVQLNREICLRPPPLFYLRSPPLFWRCPISALELTRRHK